MKRVDGQCYNIRDQLKELGCVWSADEKAWYSPVLSHGQAQSLADVENFREWEEYLGTLAWCDGEFTATVWNASLRAASLFIPYQTAWREIASRVRGVKNVSDAWFDRNVGRAYEHAEPGSAGGGEWVRPEASGGKPVEKPVFKNEVLTAVAGELSTEVSLAWLADRSPIAPMGVTAVDFLSALYEPGECVVVCDKFESQGRWLFRDGVMERSEVDWPNWIVREDRPPVMRQGREFDAQGPEGVWYLCNPVDGVFRPTGERDEQDRAQWSRRFHECVTSWRYMVLESDKARARDWVAMAVQLPLRISAIYTSGGKSVHVLVRVDARSKDEWDRIREAMRPIVVTLGADAGCLSAVRLTRLPACLRMGKKDDRGVWSGFQVPRRQKLLYLNPSADMTPIESRPVLRDSLGPWLNWGDAIAHTHAEERDGDEVARCLRGLEFFSTIPAVWDIIRRLRHGW